MKKKIFLLLAAMLLVACYFVLSVSAEELESLEEQEKIVLNDGTYYIKGYGPDGGSPYLIYSSLEDYESDGADSVLDDFIVMLFGDDFEDTVESEGNRYNNNENGEKEQYDSVEDYFIGNYGNQSERFKNNLRKQIQMVLKAKASEDNDHGGGEDDGSSGGNEGDDGSSSSGSQNGVPNVLIDSTVDTSKWEDCCCGSMVGSEQCDCYKKGYSDGWTWAIVSDAVKNALQEAFNQGFREVNTESWHDMIANEKETAVNDFKTSEEYQNEINQAKESAVTEYRESEKYVEDFESENNSAEQQEKINEIKEKVIEDFKNSPEQMEIIGQAKEDAQAEFVVEIDKVLTGERQPATENEEGMKALVEEKIQYEREDAVNDFASELDDIMSGKSEPVEGSPGESVVQNIVQNIMLSYQEGLEAGEADYKLSIEYKTALETEYEAGSEAGYQQGFLIGTNDGYSKGLLDGAELANEELYNKGKNEYMNTKAYQDTLQETYDQGYSDGSEGSDNPLLYLIPIAILAAGVTIYIVIFSRVRRKKKE